MDDIPPGEAIDTCFDSLFADRLAVLAGAGLSMAPPSSLPAAAKIAERAKQKYDSTYGSTRPPLPDAIDDQAEYFFSRGELDSTYFRILIDRNAFSSTPNAGHRAIADLLLVRALHTAVTTNVDVLIEIAGHLLFGHIEVGISGTQVATFPNTVAPLLKIHGCRVIDPPNMVWAHGQVTAPPVSDRISSSKAWLTTRLAGKDLLVVGFWTDWDYLNEILRDIFGSVRASRVIVVDPSESAELATKAPALYQLLEASTSSFQHVRTSGASFLDSLRRTFSKSYIRRVLYSGAADFQVDKGAPPNPAWLEPPDLDAETLWTIRRDLEGCLPSAPSLLREPPSDETLTGLTLLQLQALGAVSDGPYWALPATKVRVVRTSNRKLPQVEAEFARDIAPAVEADVTIAVGAESQSLLANIARGVTRPSITRGGRSRWLSRPEAIAELGL